MKFISIHHLNSLHLFPNVMKLIVKLIISYLSIYELSVIYEKDF